MVLEHLDPLTALANSFLSSDTVVLGVDPYSGMPSLRNSGQNEEKRHDSRSSEHLWWFANQVKGWYLHTTDVQCNRNKEKRSRQRFSLDKKKLT
jgi:hypothetical protein